MNGANNKFLFQDFQGNLNASSQKTIIITQLYTRIAGQASSQVFPGTKVIENMKLDKNSSLHF